MPKFWILAAVTLVSAGILPASQIYTFAVWTNENLSAGTISGTIPLSPTPVGISYSGNLYGTTQLSAFGTDYFSGYPSVYTNSVVANTPGSGNVGLVALDESTTPTNTITFSAPVLNPILDIVSLGQPGVGVTYRFSQAFTILSQGSAYFGGCNTCLTQSGNNLIGTEGSGVIQFTGTVSSISFTTVGGEAWNGFTVGVAGLAPTSTPEPGTWMSAVSALTLFAIVVLRKRTA